MSTALRRDAPDGAEAHDHRPVVAVYPEHWLTPSMTFIHRQVVGTADEFRPLVLAAEVSNVDLFPFDPVHVQRWSAAERLVGRLQRRLQRRHGVLSARQRWQWQRLLRREGAVLIHAHFGPSGLQVQPLAEALRLPLLVSFHGYDAASLLRDPTYVRGLRRLLPQAHAVAVSQVIAARLRELGAPPERLHLNRYGIPLDEFRPVRRRPLSTKLAEGESVTFLQVSNFVEKKGQADTVRAFAELARTQAASLVLAGDGPLRPSIEALCRDLGVRDRVELPGRVTTAEAAALMASADVFVHPSVTAKDGDQEGIPNVIMEAMATGLPVVSTRHAGIPELVEDGVSGLLVPEGDVAALAAAMRGVLRVGDELGARASRTVRERFDLARQAAELKALYRAVIGGGATRRPRP